MGIQQNVPNIGKAVISVHCHNDLGLAVANGALLVSTDTGVIVSFGQLSDQPSAWILY